MNLKRKTCVLLSFLVLLCLTGFSQADRYSIIRLHEKCGKTISLAENQYYHLFQKMDFTSAVFFLQDQKDILVVFDQRDTVRLNRQQLTAMYSAIDTMPLLVSGELDEPIDSSLPIVEAALLLRIAPSKPVESPVAVDTSGLLFFFAQLGLTGNMGSSGYGNGINLSAHIKWASHLLTFGRWVAAKSEDYKVPKPYLGFTETDSKKIYSFRSLYLTYGHLFRFEKAVVGCSAGLNWEEIKLHTYEVKEDTAYSYYWLSETSSHIYNGPGVIISSDVWIFPAAAVCPSIGFQIIANPKYTTVGWYFALRFGRIYPRRHSL